MRSATSAGSPSWATPRQHDDELVATEPGEHVVVADDAAQAAGHRAQQLVADAVAEAVVHDLEVVEVDEQHGNRRWRRAVEPFAQQRHQRRPVRKSGELVVVGRERQLLGGSLLLGDVLDVGDRQHRAVVLGERHPRPGPHELTVAAEVALVEPVRVDDAELEPGAVRHRGPDVVGVGELAERVADELVDLEAEHLGERLVGVDDPAIVDADERHAGRGRVERLLEPTPRLLERPRVLLALGQVAQPQHHPPLGRATRRVRGPASSRSGSSVPSGLRARWKVASTSTDPSSPTRRTGAGSTISPAIARRQLARSSSRSAASTRSRKNERTSAAGSMPHSSVAEALADSTRPSESSSITASGSSSSRRRTAASAVATPARRSRSRSSIRRDVT